MKASEAAAEAIAERMTTYGWRPGISVAGHALAAVMPDGRTVAQWLDDAEALREAVAEVPRHTPWADTGRCSECGSFGWPDSWPCPTERLHRLAEGSTDA